MKLSLLITRHRVISFSQSLSYKGLLLSDMNLQDISSLQLDPLFNKDESYLFDITLIRYNSALDLVDYGKSQGGRKFKSRTSFGTLRPTESVGVGVGVGCVWGWG